MKHFSGIVRGTCALPHGVVVVSVVCMMVCLFFLRRVVFFFHRAYFVVDSGRMRMQCACLWWE